eukprot:COSAG06_NODE_3081_length_5886_cov_5.736997_5_plen_75_part_00
MKMPGIIARKRRVFLPCIAASLSPSIKLNERKRVELQLVAYYIGVSKSSIICTGGKRSGCVALTTHGAILINYA